MCTIMDGGKIKKEIFFSFFVVGGDDDDDGIGRSEIIPLLPL